MVDMALATKFELEDKDEVDLILWQLKQFIASVGKGLKVKYPSNLKNKPVARIEQIKKNVKKELGLNNKVEIPSEIPTQEELFKRWNIKK